MYIIAGLEGHRIGKRKGVCGTNMAERKNSLARSALLARDATVIRIRSEAMLVCVGEELRASGRKWTGLHRGCEKRFSFAWRSDCDTVPCKRKSILR